jgi:hypothetical protein
MKYYIYDIDGCAYYDSIKITTSPLKGGYLIAECSSAHEANLEASRYLYDTNRSVAMSHDSNYWEENGGYPPYEDDEDFIIFVNEDDDDYDDDDDDDDDDYKYDDDDDDYDDDEEEEW